MASQLRADRNDTWKWHSSCTVAAEVLQVHRSAISHCIAGRQANAGGYEFRPAEPELLPGEQWKVVHLQDLGAIHGARLRTASGWGLT